MKLSKEFKRGVVNGAGSAVGAAIGTGLLLVALAFLYGPRVDEDEQTEQAALMGANRQGCRL